MTTRSEKPPALRIGSLRIFPPVMLAPMSALTTVPFRTLAEEQGCSFTLTEFLPAAGLSAKNAKLLGRMAPSALGQPFGVQLYGHDAAQMRRGARLAADAGAALIDINMGCPTRRVTGRCAGAALLRDPDLAETLVHAVRDGTADAVPVTVKMRIGWDSQQINAVAFATRMAAAGVAAVTVHGRTRAQRYAGDVDLAPIAAVKQALDIPVIANGDVVDLPSLKRTLNTTHADGVMIGRGALGNPWLFATLAAWWEERPLPGAPTLHDACTVLARHLELALRTTEEAHAVKELRKFARWTFERFPETDALLRRLFAATTAEAVREALQAAPGACYASASSRMYCT